MSFLSDFFLLDRNYNLGTAVIQCTSVPGGTAPIGFITVNGTTFTTLCANHMPVNYKSIVTSGPDPSNGYFTLKAGTYKAFYTIQSILQTTTYTETYANYSARIRIPTVATIAKFANSFIGANGATWRMVNGDYIQETSFTLSADSTIHVSHRNNSGTNRYTGYSSTAWANLTPYQVYAQLILQKIA